MPLDFWIWAKLSTGNENVIHHDYGTCSSLQNGTPFQSRWMGFSKLEWRGIPWNRRTWRCRFVYQRKVRWNGVMTTDKHDGEVWHLTAWREGCGLAHNRQIDRQTSCGLILKKTGRPMWCGMLQTYCTYMVMWYGIPQTGYGVICNSVVSTYQPNMMMHLGTLKMDSMMQCGASRAYKITIHRKTGWCGVVWDDRQDLVWCGVVRISQTTMMYWCDIPRTGWCGMCAKDRMVWCITDRRTWKHGTSQRDMCNVTHRQKGVVHCRQDVTWCEIVMIHNMTSDFQIILTCILGLLHT